MNIVSTAVYHLWISDVLPTTHGKKKKKSFLYHPQYTRTGWGRRGFTVVGMENHTMMKKQLYNNKLCLVFSRL